MSSFLLSKPRRARLLPVNIEKKWLNSEAETSLTLATEVVSLACEELFQSANVTGCAGAVAGPPLARPADQENAVRQLLA